MLEVEAEVEVEPRCRARASDSILLQIQNPCKERKRSGKRAKHLRHQVLCIARMARAVVECLFFVSTGKFRKSEGGYFRKKLRDQHTAEFSS